MTHCLNLELNRAEGVLVRVLGLTERRGYQPLQIAAEPRGDGTTLALSLTVFSERPIEQLIRQLEKLFDVRTVERIALDLALPQAAK